MEGRNRRFFWSDYYHNFSINYSSPITFVLVFIVYLNRCTRYTNIQLSPSQSLHDNELIITSNQTFSTILDTRDHANNMIDLTQLSLSILIVNLHTNVSVLQEVDVMDPNFILKLETGYEVYHQISMEGVYEIRFIIESSSVDHLPLYLISSSFYLNIFEFYQVSLIFSTVLVLVVYSHQIYLSTLPTHLISSFVTDLRISSHHVSLILSYYF